MFKYRRLLFWLRVGLITIAVASTGLLIWVAVLSYRFVDEMLGVAQRGYFISTPKVPDAVVKSLRDEARRRLSKEIE